MGRNGIFTSQLFVMNLEGRSLDKGGVALCCFMTEIRETVFVKVGENENAFTTGNVNVSQPCTYIIQAEERGFLRALTQLVVLPHSGDFSSEPTPQHLD